MNVSPQRAQPLQPEYNLLAIEQHVGASFAEMQAMAAEIQGVTFDPRLLHAEQLATGLGSLGIMRELPQSDIDAILLHHSFGQTQFKDTFDLPFSEQERGISAQIFDILVPLKHMDQYATDELILGEYTKAEKEIASTVLGRLSTRNMLEVGIRSARKRRGNFHYTKWPTPQSRRDYIHHPEQVLGGLRTPYQFDIK